MPKASFGSVEFEFELTRVNPDDPVVLGSDERACDGTMISLVYEEPVQDRIEKVIFDWEPWATVAALKAMAASFSTFTINFTGSGPTAQARFQHPNGLTGVKHSYYSEKQSAYPGVVNKRQDRWYGEMNLIIEAP